MHKENKRQKIEAILKSNPSLSLREVAKRVGCDFSYVFMVRRAMAERGEPVKTDLGPTKTDLVKEALRKDPFRTLASIAEEVGCNTSYVWKVRNDMVPREEIPCGTRYIKPVKKPNPFPFPHRTLAEVAPEPQDTHDEVNHPAHYTDGGIETIDFIQAKLSPEEFRGYCRGNAMKYLSRAGKKGDAATDLAKANWYLNRIKKDA